MPNDQHKTIFDNTKAFLEQYVGFTSEDDATLCTAWIAHTHIYRKLRSTPRLWIDSPIPGSGKTTLLEHMAQLAANTQLDYELTAAKVKYLADQGYTILVDEADRALNSKREGQDTVASAINSGYRESGSTVTLTPDPKTGLLDLRRFKLFAPLALAGNHVKLPADLASRCIKIQLMPAKDIKPTRLDMLQGDHKRLHNALQDWGKAFTPPSYEDAALPEEIQGRLAEKWEPLKRSTPREYWETIDQLALQELEAIEAAKELEDMPNHIAALDTIYQVFTLLDGKEGIVHDFLPSIELVEEMQRINPARWDSYTNKLTVKYLAHLLDPFKIKSDRPMRNNQRRRGYYRASFIVPWHRMLGLEDINYTGATTTPA